MKRYLTALVLLFVAKGAFATSTVQPVALTPAVSVSSISASGGQAAVTITAAGNAGSYSSGLYIYVSHIHIEMYAVSTLTGGATPVTCTTTNLSSAVFKFNTAQATGTMQIQDVDYSSLLTPPLANTSVVVTCPATANVIWNVQVLTVQAP